MLDNTIALVQAQHRIVRRIQAKQAAEARIKTNPLRSQNAQNMRMRDQQHVLPRFDKRRHLPDRVAGAGSGIIKAFARAGMHLHTFAIRKRLLPIRIHGFRQGRRTVTPHIPIETGHIAHRLAGAPLSAAIIPFRDVVERGDLIETSQSCRLLRPLQWAGEHATLIETFGECGTKPFTGHHSLPFTDRRQRDIRTSGMLPRFAPHGLPVAKQNQVPGLRSGRTAAQFVFTHSHTLPRTRRRPIDVPFPIDPNPHGRAHCASMDGERSAGGRLVRMSDETYTASESTADRAVEALHRIDSKVAALRKQRLEDPDSATDKLAKAIIPTVTSMVAGKLFQLAWDKAWKRRGRNTESTGKELAMTLAFTAASAAFGAAVSTLSERGSQAMIDRRHRKGGKRSR